MNFVLDPVAQVAQLLVGLQNLVGNHFLRYLAEHVLGQFDLDLYFVKRTFARYHQLIVGNHVGNAL